ncbi:peptidoglycan-binding protein [Plectonema cf. radiosum LEGE 06105]|uniref:Peptidoglycan-binding protein n=1 Tax=Plectonema cf. radiosum LEGE 06105 TaxID=945769 RepID=A0A8J7JRT6_9CYAN|nr:peptidoglycan-binding protein [Plectonema cf. radiosum LEGE 06105]
MIGSRKISIFKYLSSLVSFRFLPINRIYWLVLLSSTPLLFGSQIGISIAAKQQTIAQVVVEANINRPNLKIGSEGVPVRELQGALILLGFYEGEVNGVFTETTQKAVARFQQAAGLKADGVVDTNTWETLFPNATVSTEVANTPTPPPFDTFPVPTESLSNVRVVNNSTQQQRPITPAVESPVRIVQPAPEPKPATPPKNNSQPKPVKPKPRTTATVQPKPVQKQAATTRTRQTTTSSSSQTKTSTIQYTAQGLPILRPGMRGSQVVELQQKLSKLGFLKSIDGDFGPVTTEAVKAFQKRNGLEPDGVVGGATWQLLDRGKRN